MAVLLKLTTVKCARCQYEWAIRKPTLPKVCPKCWTRHWNEEPLPFDGKRNGA